MHYYAEPAAGPHRARRAVYPGLRDIAINSGRYSVHEIKEGQSTVRPLWFSFVYLRHEGRWLIIDHHSSALPPK